MVLTAFCAICSNFKMKGLGFQRQNLKKGKELVVVEIEVYDVFLLPVIHN